MARLFSCRNAWLAAAALIAILSAPASAAPKGCFEVRVDYLGREPVANINGVQYYRWSYRVTGMGCISRSLDYWTLGLCAQTLDGLTQVSLQSGDTSDSPNGVMSNYKTKFGKDPLTDVTGLEWKFQSGNPVNVVGECDDFSFVATGGITPIAWGAKGANFIATGTTFGPTCAPVPVQPSSWGAVKALFRS